MQQAQLLGLDVGQKRTGIARASMVAKLAEPYATIETKEVPAYLKKLTGQMEVAAIVVGLPRNLDGDDTAQTKWVREWAHNIKDQVNRPFYWQDEALTTHQAASAKSKNSAGEDAVAASIILQDFLDLDEEQWLKF